MSFQWIATMLYRELIFISMILLAILLVNNIQLYHIKIKDHLSLMLIVSVVMCFCELVWDICSGRPELSIPSYAAAFGYVLSTLIAASIFNRYFLKIFGIATENRLINVLMYILPNAAVFILCIFTAWTHLVYWVDGSGVIREGPLFEGLFMPLVLIYTVSVLLLAVYHALRDRKKEPEKLHLAIRLVVFGTLTLGIYLLQMIVLGEANTVYMSLSVSWSLALVFLITAVNTKSLVKRQAQIESIESDLRIASKIQTDALPPAAPEFESYVDCNLRAAMNTAREVGGDFYDYFAVDDRRLCFLIADVSGKGTPAALFMMTVKTMIKDHAFMYHDTAELFTVVNRRISEQNDAGMFATAWIGIFDKETHVLQYTNAGHNFPLLLKGGVCEEMRKVHGLFLGGLDETVYKKNELKLEAGDRLLLYTDGITEAHDTKGGLYGTQRLIRAFENAAELSGEEVLASILQNVNTFALGMPQFDDMTMMILTIKQ